MAVELTQNNIPKIAIVGMGCHLGDNCKDLDNFERSIYEGKQDFIPLNSPRHQDKFAYIRESEIDTSSLQISPEHLDNFHLHELLMLKVADHALKDARLPQGSRIAVIITTSQNLAHISSANNSHNYPIYLENKIADHLAKVWNFAGAKFTLIAEQNSVFKSLEIAQKLLSIQEVDAVLLGAVELVEDTSNLLACHQNTQINTGVNTLSYDQNVNGWIAGEGAAAVVLQLYETAQQNSHRIYAVIEALSLIEDAKSKIYSVPTMPDAGGIIQACQTAFRLANIQPTDINYLEVVGSGIPKQDESEIQGLLQAYKTPEASLSCAVGSVKANFGHTWAASGIVSLIKTALCLYHRYIPAVPQWYSPKNPEIWQDSPFYVATESKPWFLETGVTRRIAAINGMEMDGSYAHIILSEEINQTNYSSKYLAQMPYYMFAIAADDQATLLEQIHTLQQTIQDCSSLAYAASLTFKAYQQHQQGKYALAILGRNQDELIREIQRAITGVTVAFQTGKDWVTPVGSYFTSQPLGKENQVSFVYPGSFNSYIGLGRDLFRLFPHIYDDPAISSIYNRVTNIEKLFYPRSLQKLSKKQLEILEQKLIDDPITMLESEVGIAGLMTSILSNYFQLKPRSVFGYSLGENSMMFAQGVWTEFNESIEGLNTSPLFKTRLSGPKNAVREYWGLPLMPDDYQDKKFWSNYVILCPIDRIQEAIQREKRVYLTLINTPEEAVISGDTEACQRVIQALNCHAHHTPINHVIHCHPMKSEYDELVKINTLPIQKIPDTTFYCAAEYSPITLNNNSIGDNIAKTLCQHLDFPKLINRVYNDGYKIFIEVGVGSNCSRWIGETLKQQAHLAVSLNRRGVDSHTSIIRALGKLVSHRVNLDLSPLYFHPNFNNHKNHKNLSEVKNQHILEHEFSSLLINNGRISRESLKNTFSVNQTRQPHLKPHADYQDMLDPNHSLNASQSVRLLVCDQQNDHALNKEALTTPQENESLPINDALNSQNIFDENSLTNLRSLYYQKLKQNVDIMTKNHANLLDNRQESLKQISTIIQQQLALSHKLFDLENTRK
jgi:PfaB family protein